MQDRSPSSDQARPADIAAATEPKRLDRRALLRMGTGAAPVLLTLASSPVSANPVAGCFVASSFVSVATFKSRNASATSISCSTQPNKVEDWQAKASVTPTPANLARTVGATLGVASSTWKDETLAAVLSRPLATAGEIAFAQHMVAMYLNCENGYITSSAGGMNCAYLSAMWTNFWSNGAQYQATGIRWYFPELIAYLRLHLGYTMLA